MTKKYFIFYESKPELFYFLRKHKIISLVGKDYITDKQKPTPVNQFNKEIIDLPVDPTGQYFFIDCRPVKELEEKINSSVYYTKGQITFYNFIEQTALGAALLNIYGSKSYLPREVYCILVNEFFGITAYWLIQDKKLSIKYDAWYHFRLEWLCREIKRTENLSYTKNTLNTEIAKRGQLLKNFILPLNSKTQKLSLAVILKKNFDLITKESAGYYQYKLLVRLDDRPIGLQTGWLFGLTDTDLNLIKNTKNLFDYDHITKDTDKVVLLKTNKVHH